MPPTAGDRARRVRRVIGAVVGVPLLLVGLVAIGHTRAARPVLAWMGASAPGCPALADPKKVESARVASLLPLRGTARAASRPALQFTLMASTKADVLAWSKANRVTCGEELAGATLRCHDVPAGVAASGAAAISATGAREISDLMFRFDPASTLVSLDAMYAGTSAEAAADSLAALATSLSRDVGPPTSPLGDHSATYLASAPYAQSGAQFRFRDYAADVTATNFGAKGIVVREQYRALPD